MKKKNKPNTKNQKKTKQVKKNGQSKKKKTTELSPWQKFACFGAGAANLAKALEIIWNLWP